MSDTTRWERRYRRERDARHQAEAIAERAIGDLLEANRDLDRRVDERTRQLQAALGEVAVARRAERTFLHGLAHEIRTPLNVILGLTEILVEDAQGAKARALARDVHRASTRLNEALQTLIEFSAVSGSDMAVTRQSVELADVSSAIADRWTKRAARRGALLIVELNDKPELELMVDPDRLGQVLDPLVDNATRFGGQTVRVTLEVQNSAGTGDLVVRVSDDGPGVALDQRETLFDPFVRSDESEGFGMGLALSRTVARQLGGDVRLLPSDEGVVFEALVPCGLDLEA